MISIRRRLLIILLAIFTAAWTAVTAVTYSVANHEIEELFDAQLSQEAGILSELTLATLKSKSMLPRKLSRDIYGHKYERYISFQIWEGDQLRFRSNGAPDTRLAKDIGFVDRFLDGVHWRVFGLHDESNQYTIYAAESYQTREELVEDISLGTLIPLLVALPLVALLLWIGIGRGLAPLNTIAQEVSRRSSNQLELITETDVPIETLPLIRSLNNLFERLTKAFEAERRFTADASHELRTPLASIKTQAQVALKANNDSERTHALKNIVYGVNRGARLVEQMLTLARLEPDLNNNELCQTINLVFEVENVLAEMKSLATEYNVSLVLNTPEEKKNGCQIMAYVPAIEILVRNLVENAIHYTPAGTEVTVTIQIESDKCLLSVTDQGAGIPQKEHERIFDAFYRQAGQDVYGSGLGLAIVKRIADIHDARITIHSGQNGTGTCVDVRFKNIA
ncbi:MAG: ATP-binding protein [Gammaproteobacteria bacterium]|nr:ATP-binding protein [Gammaproteobacteria bacterium]